MQDANGSTMVGICDTEKENSSIGKCCLKMAFKNRYSALFGATPVISYDLSRD